MKIKEVCTRTGLTEKSIRLYKVSEQLYIFVRSIELMRNLYEVEKRKVRFLLLELVVLEQSCL